jgi:hypothetical protein
LPSSNNFFPFNNAWLPAGPHPLRNPANIPADAKTIKKRSAKGNPSVFSLGRLFLVVNIRVGGNIPVRECQETR